MAFLWGSLLLFAQGSRFDFNHTALLCSNSKILPSYWSATAASSANQLFRLEQLNFKVEKERGS